MVKLKLIIVTSLFSVIFSLSAMEHPGDSIVAMHTTVLPNIDGSGSDEVWNSANWVDMNYTWIPYNQTVPVADFTGRFKVLWNKTTQLLYFLVEITDDKFVNGYVYDKFNGSYPNFDVVELFIDEDRSGGDHTSNNNAFAYHITSGNATTDYDAIDIFDSTPNAPNWSAGIYVNYKNHFPEFKRTNVGTKYTWEFSLMALTSNYTPANNPTLFKTNLTVGKAMGLTMNYCDNDNSAVNPVRDNFFSSKYVNPSDNNSSWQFAYNFGSMVLKEKGGYTGIKSARNNEATIWVDGAKQLNCKLNESWNRPTFQLLNISGSVLFEKEMIIGKKIDLSAYKQGFYLAVIKENQSIFTQKINL